MATVRPIDCLQLGHARGICCWQHGDVLIDPGPTSCLENVMAELDVEPRVLLLTHIHLDHAGAAGTLARRFPKLEVYVHERGARHMIDPTKLLASATRLYGERMDLLWGAFEPVPEDRVRVLRGGERIDLGEAGTFEVAYTPGHAVHHVSYLHEDGTAYVGDVAGVRSVPGGPVVPPTPPPDIDIEAWRRSIELLGAWQPQRLAYTHWGSSEDVPEHLADLSDRLARWSEAARDRDLDGWVELVAAELAGLVSVEQGRDRYGQSAAADANYAGLRRYWDKRMLNDDVANA